MPIYQEDSPLAAAAGFAGSYFDAQQQAKAAQAAAARQAALDAAAAQQTSWKDAFDQRAQDNTLDTDAQKRYIAAQMFPLDYQGKSLSNQNLGLDAQGKAISNKVAGATAPARISQAQSSAVEANFRAQAAQYGAGKPAADAIIAQVNAQYAPQDKAAALADVYARIAGTQASTAGTQQRTQFGALEEPGKLTAQGYANTGKQISNLQGIDKLLNPTAPKGATAATDVATKLKTGYSEATKEYAQSLAFYHAQHPMGPQPGDATGPPAPPEAPETVHAKLAPALDALRSAKPAQRKTLAAGIIAKIRKTAPPYAQADLINEVQQTASGTTGGSTATGPFSAAQFLEGLGL